MVKESEKTCSTYRSHPNNLEAGTHPRLINNNKQLPDNHFTKTLLKSKMSNLKDSIGKVSDKAVKANNSNVHNKPQTKATPVSREAIDQTQTMS